MSEELKIVANPKRDEVAYRIIFKITETEVMFY